MGTDRRRLDGKLSLRELLGVLRAGGAAKPKKDVLDPIRIASGPPPEADVAQRVETLVQEQRDVAGKQASHEESLVRVQTEQKECASEEETLLARRPLFLRTFLYCLLGLALLGGDATFAFAALADAWGVPLDQGYVAPRALVVVLGVTILVALATAFAGTLVTGHAYSPARRIVGGILLLGISGFLAAVRHAATPEASMLVALLGIATSISGGVCAGLAKHEAAAWLAAYEEFHRRRKMLRRRRRSLKAQAKAVSKELAYLDARRRGLAIEIDELRPDGARSRWHAEARVARARAAYDFAAWLFGRRRPGSTEP